MAKIEYSALVNSISGRNGGVVFSRWQGVPLIRRFVRPSNPNTMGQMDHRNAFRNMTRLYAGLPVGAADLDGTDVGDIIKQLWANSASGRPGQGRNFFIGRFLGFDPISLTGGQLLPGSSSFGAPVTTANVATAGELELTMTVTAAPTGYEIVGVVGVAVERPVTPPNWNGDYPNPSVGVQLIEHTAVGAAVVTVNLDSGTYDYWAGVIYQADGSESTRTLVVSPQATAEAVIS